MPHTLAVRNNNPGNLRFADWQAEHGGAPNGGFTKYPTIDDGIRASVHLLSMGSYKPAIDRRDWGAVISRYAPSSENDTATYIREMNEWTADYRTKLGISEHWVHGVGATRPASESPEQIPGRSNRVTRIIACGEQPKRCECVIGNYTGESAEGSSTTIPSRPKIHQTSSAPMNNMPMDDAAMATYERRVGRGRR